MVTNLKQVSIAVLLSGSIYAHAAPSNIEISSQPLDKAINALAKQTGENIAFSTDLTEKLSANALKGSYTAEEALGILLKGTGLILQKNAGGYAIIKAPSNAADTLPEVTVKATTELFPNDLPKPYAGGQVAKASRVGILGNVDLFDTPFSTQSYTEEFARDQQARRVADIITVDPSVRSIQAEYGDTEQYFIRGFPVFVSQVGVNGLYGMTEVRRIAPEFYERVEVLKGPASMLNGISPFGVVGGNVNLVSKRATNAQLTRLSGIYISDSQFGGHLDFGRRFGENNAWGIRLNALAREGDTPINRQEDRMFNGSLALDYRGEKLKASLDIANQDRLTKAPSGVLNYNQGFAIPRASENDKNYANDWEYYKANSNYWSARADYEISEAFTPYASYGKSQFNEEYLFAATQGRRFINSAGDFTAQDGGFKGFGEAETYELGLRGRFMLGSVSNSYALSYSDFQRTSNGVTVNATTPYIGNIYNNPVRPKPTVTFNGIPQNGDLELSSVGLVNTFGFMKDDLLLTLGVRDQKLINGNFAAGVKTSSYEANEITPTGALLVKFGKTSLYANYSEGLAQGATAPIGTVNQGENLSPFITKQYEAGAKYNAGTFGLTAAVFQITQPSAFTNATNVFVEDGEQRNRGLELSTFGKPFSGVRLLGGITLIDAEQIKTVNGINDGKDAIGVPKVNVVVNGEYDIFAVPGLTLTARVTGFSEAQAEVGNTQSIPGWTRFDAGARYITQLSGKVVTFRANVINLTDKDYWGSASRGFITLGAPRTALISATVDF